MVEPLATMGWVSAPLLDSPFTALELSSLKLWSVRPAKSRIAQELFAAPT